MNEFVFQSPKILALLLLAPALWWLLAFARKRRLEAIAALGGGPGTRRLRRDSLRVAALVLLVLALARPGYAPRIESVSRIGRDVVFALDVSRSMLAEDAPPSRLEAAKQAVHDALDALDGERAGLVVYAGSASVMCPLTYDYDFVRYMVDQAQPRTVEFGGTTLQSAVEKSVDQVFMKDRDGMQDLVVLTDGGDHGSKVGKMAELLDEKQVDVLLVGIGDPETASPIPIPDEDGKPTLLEDDGEIVLTRLNDAALREFASKCARARYIAAGTAPFDLGMLYREYASHLPHDAAETGTGIRVYREAAVFLLIPALILLWLAECHGGRGFRWPWTRSAAALMVFGAFVAEARAADAAFEASFRSATAAMEKGDYQAANERLAGLYRNSSAREAGPRALAALHFNRGLCLLKLSETQTQAEPEEALATALEARRAFLTAKRAAPDFPRAGARLESTAEVLTGLRQRVAERKKADREMADALQKLLDRLQDLLKAQKALRAKVASVDPHSTSPRRKPPAPPDAASRAEEFSTRQSALKAEARSIEEAMKPLDEKLREPVPDQPPKESILAEPLRLMKKVEAAQGDAATALSNWDTWPAARSRGRAAEVTIQEILDLLANANPQPGESDKSGDELPDEGDYTQTDDSQSGIPTSLPMSGDFAADAGMRELPVPNYSAEDILKEERGSLQFRQQKRGEANAAKVKKDY